MSQPTGLAAEDSCSALLLAPTFGSGSFSSFVAQPGLFLQFLAEVLHVVEQVEGEACQALLRQ